MAFLLLLLQYVLFFHCVCVLFTMTVSIILSAISAVGCESTWQTVLNNNVKVWLFSNCSNQDEHRLSN